MSKISIRPSFPRCDDYDLLYFSTAMETTFFLGQPKFPLPPSSLSFSISNLWEYFFSLLFFFLQKFTRTKTVQVYEGSSSKFSREQVRERSPSTQRVVDNNDWVW